MRGYQPYYINDWRYVDDKAMRTCGYADTRFHDAPRPGSRGADDLGLSAAKQLFPLVYRGGGRERYLDRGRVIERRYQRGTTEPIWAGVMISSMITCAAGAPPRIWQPSCGVLHRESDLDLALSNRGHLHWFPVIILDM